MPAVAEPDAGSLLARLARGIDEGMLREIAAADYGRQADEHFAHLRRMRDQGDLPPLDPGLLEVLELIRWSEPEQPGWRPGCEGRRGHLMRAFCCAWLLRIAAESEGYVIDLANETVIQLISSLDRLDDDCWDEAAGLLSWFCPRWSSKGLQEREEDALLGVGILFAALRAGTPDAQLVALSEWIAQREEAIGSSWQFDERWGLRATHSNMRREAWCALGTRLAELDLAGRDPALRDWVGLIGESFATG